MSDLTTASQRQTSPIKVTSTSLFDPVKLQRLTHGLEKEGRFAQRYVIQDDDDQADVAERLVEWKRLAKAVEAYYDSLAREHLDALTKLRDLCRPFKNLVALGLGAYTGALGTYEVEKAKRTRAALEAAKEAARERDSKALTRRLNEVQDSKPQKLAGVTVSVVWQVDDVDLDKLPEKFILRDVNLRALQSYAAGYLPTETPKPIAGVTFKLGAKQTVRT